MRRGDVRSLFRRVGDEVTEEMNFLVELIVPETGEDLLGQQAVASMTFLRYELKLRYRPDALIDALGTIEVVAESMVHINRSEAANHLFFPHKPAWRKSVIRGRRTSPYVSTETEDGKTIIALHADSVGGASGGRPRRILASSLPRTMLSSVSNAAEHRTLVLARQEMVSWTQLQLEPSALRAPDGFTASRSIAPNGAHLPATLFEQARTAERSERGGAENVFARVANRLSELVENVQRIRVDIDEKRQLFNVIMTDHQGTEHVAGVLSDGTLRFLALIIMEADPKGRRLLCLEEPENGMHPLRIPAMVRLIEELAVDPTLEVDVDNPLRQIIINTHSPSVVAFVEYDALLVARGAHVRRGEREEVRLVLEHLPETWRQQSAPSVPTVSRSDLLAWLAPFNALPAEETEPSRAVAPRRQRVLHRHLQQLSLFGMDNP
jgi:predicted ATPase